MAASPVPRRRDDSAADADNDDLTAIPNDNDNDGVLSGEEMRSIKGVAFDRSKTGQIRAILPPETIKFFYKLSTADRKSFDGYCSLFAFLCYCALFFAIYMSQFPNEPNFRVRESILASWCSDETDAVDKATGEIVDSFDDINGAVGWMKSTVLNLYEDSPCGDRYCSPQETRSVVDSHGSRGCYNDCGVWDDVTPYTLEISVDAAACGTGTGPGKGLRGGLVTTGGPTFALSMEFEEGNYVSFWEDVHHADLQCGNVGFTILSHQNICFLMLLTYAPLDANSF